MYTVYVLESLLDNGFYIGVTGNLEDRLKRHFEGRSKATKHRGPWKLVYTEIFNDKHLACKREYYFKSLKSKVFIKRLVAPSSSGQDVSFSS